VAVARIQAIAADDVAASTETRLQVIGQPTLEPHRNSVPSPCQCVTQVNYALP
jgi:hypothetical protein